MVRFGVALILLSVALLTGAFLLPDVLTPLAPLYCHAGETLTQKTFTFSIPGESSTTFYYHCANAQGVETADVSNAVTWTILAAFAILEASGIALMIIGGRRRRQYADGDSKEHHIPRRFRAPKAGMTLAERLHQLQEAHNEGLIDNNEYVRLREDALDKLK